MKCWTLGTVLLATGLATGCKSGPSADQCKRLLDHLVDLEFKKAGATASDAAKAELAKQKQAVSDAKSSEFIEACTRRTAKTRVDCALAAGSLEAVAKCDETK